MFVLVSDVFASEPTDSFGTDKQPNPNANKLYVYCTCALNTSVNAKVK